MRENMTWKNNPLKFTHNTDIKITVLLYIFVQVIPFSVSFLRPFFSYCIICKLFAFPRHFGLLIGSLTISYTLLK